MPIIQRFLYEDAEVAVWKIEEPEDFFRQATGLESLIRVDKRRIEFYAGRYLLAHCIPGLHFEDVRIDAIGKPYLAKGDFYFSISHSFPYVAVAIHTQHSVGVDIQVFRKKIIRLGPKFLSHSEADWAGESVKRTTLLWSAKEAMYKWRGVGGQQFSEQLLVHRVAHEHEVYKMDCEVLDDIGSKKHPLIVQGRIADDYAIALASAPFSH